MNSDLTPDHLIRAVAEWAKLEDRIAAAAICGSHARGTATAESDIDVCLICSQPERLLGDLSWVAQFGNGRIGPREDYGLTQSVRVHYEHGLEVEFGIAGTKWMELPLDPGTARVFRDGLKVLFDPDGQLDRAINSVND